jgi:PAS domain S-box-containing protein
MENKINKLLLRQIKRHFGSFEKLPNELESFIVDINNSYENFEDDTRLLQNSIEISSQELRNAFQRHKEDADAQKLTINKIKEAIQVIKPSAQNSASEREMTTSDSPYLLNSLINIVEESKKAEEQILKLSIAVEQNPASIVITDTKGNIEYVNPKFCALTGYSKEEAIGKNPKILKSDASDDFYKDLWETILAGNEWKGEFHNRKKNGDLYWELASISAVKNSSGEIVNFLAIKEDITERKLVSEALKESAKKYRDVVENIKEVIFQTDADGLWLFLNNAWEEITGFSVDESIGQLFVNFVHPDDRQRNMELFEPLIQRKKDYCRHQIRYLTKDGGFRWIEVFARLGLNEKDEITGTFGTLQDITERKLAEETLLNERTLFRTIIDLIPNAVYVKDTEGRKIIANPKEVQLSGWNSEDDIIGKTDFDLYPKKQAKRSVEEDHLVLQSGKPILNIEGTLTNKEGLLNSLLVSKVPLYDINGKITGLVGVTHDITERKRMENQLKESENLQRSLLENIAVGIVIIDPETRIIESVNTFASSLIGDRIENIVGHKCHQFMCPALENSCPVCDKGLEVDNSERILLRADKTTIDVLKTVKKIHIGGKEKLLESFVDISVQKQTEEALYQSSQKWEAIISASPDGIGMVSLDGKLQFMSDKLAGMYGYSVDQKDEYIGNPILNFIDPSNHKMLSDNFQKLIRGEEEYKITEYQAIRKDNSRFYVDVNSTVLNDANGNPATILFIERDITNRKQVEEKLKANEENFRTFFSSIADLLFVLDGNGNIIDVNQAVIRRLEYSKEELMGQSVLMIHPEARREEAVVILTEMLAGNKDFCPIPVISKSGIEIQVETKVYPGVWDGKPALFGVAKDVTKIKQSEEKFSKAFQSGSNLMAISTINTGRYIDVNEMFLQVLEFSREEIIGHTSQELNLFEDNHEREILISNLKNNNFVKDAEVKIRTKNGQELIGLFSASYIQIGDEPCWLTTMTDITQRKLAEKALQRSETLLRSIMDTTSDVIFVKDRECRFVYINPAGCLLNGKTQEQLIGYSKADLITNLKELEKFMADDLRIIEKGISETFEEEVFGADGNLYTFLTTKVPRYDGQGNIIGLIGVAHDITQRKKAKDDLEQISTRLSLATLAGGVGVWEFDIVNKILLWDDQMFTLYGVEKKKFENTYETWLKAIHPDDVNRADEEIKLAIRGEKDFNTEFQICRPDGTVHNIRALAIVQHDNSGKPLRIIGTNWDITDQKKTEAVLLNARQEAELANRAKSEFLANVSHEIRTPMNAILGFSEILFDKIENPKHKEHIKAILSSGRTLLSLINDILDLSKIEAGKLEIEFEPMNLNQKLFEIQQLFTPKVQKKQLALEIITSKNVPNFIYMDDVRFHQILFNIVGNAIKFTEKGFVKIETKILINKNNKFDLSIEVEDSGIGIPNDQLELIFEGFRQQSGQSSRSYEGTGLGLALTKKLLEKMDGEITVKSKVGKGSTFTILLHNINEAEGSTNLEQVYDNNDVNLRFENSSILIVDDIDFNCQLIRELLDYDGLTFIDAESGEKALEILELEKPDLIFMDIRMQGINGISTTEIIKTNHKLKNIPVIALTASALQNDEQKIKSLFDGYIRKPASKKDLLNAIKKFLPFKTEKVGPTPSIDIMKLCITDPLMHSTISEMVKNLELQFIEKWKNIKDNLVIFEIDEFCIELEKFNTQYNCDVLSQYIVKLKDSIQEFNVEKIEETLSSFEELINNLKKVLQ